MSHNFYNPLMPDLSQYGRMVFGGGGGTTTQLSELPEWARPAVESSLNKAVDLEQSGRFGHVQELTPEQKTALGRQAELGERGGVFDQTANDSYAAGQAYRDAASGTGIFGADALGQQTQALRDSISQVRDQTQGQYRGQQNRLGALSSARGQAASNYAADKAGGDLAAAELANRRQAALSGAQGVIGSGSEIQSQFGAGANLLGQVGSSIQEQGQREGDSDYQGVKRLFGLYGNPALGTSTTTTGGGK